MRTLLRGALAAALVALLLILLRRRADEREVPETIASSRAPAATPGEDPVTAEATLPGAAPARRHVTGHGRLRLLNPAEAAQVIAGGRVEKWHESCKRLAEAQKPWATTKISLNFSDTPLDEVLKEFAIHGLLAHLAPTVDPEITVTFKVDDLQADQAFDLILKMGDLGWQVDDQGMIVIRRKEDFQVAGPAPENEIYRLHQMSQWTRAHLARPRSDAQEIESRTRIATQRVDVSVVRQPLREAIRILSEAAGVRIWAAQGRSPDPSNAPNWDAETTVVGQDVLLTDALREALAPVNLRFEIEGGRVEVMTPEELESRITDEKDRKQADVDLAAERDTFRAKVVHLEGDRLSISDIAAQLAPQIGCKVFLDIPTSERLARWAAEGDEMTLGEVLDALGSGVPLAWWNREADFIDGDYVENLHELWFATSNPDE